MADGKMDGLFIMGQNPAVGASNARLQRTAMSKLKWLVVRDMVEIESASWWYNSPEVERGELRPQDIATEVFLFPAAGSAEKEGCQTNTQRLVQYRDAGGESAGRRAQRNLVHASPGAPAEGQSRGRSQSAQRRAQRAAPGPTARTAFTTSRTSTKC